MKLPSKIHNLVWLQTSFIGDIVLTTAAMKVAAEHFPAARQHLITTKVGAEVLAGLHHLTSVHVFDKRGSSLWAAARDIRRALGAQLSPGGGVLLRPHKSFRSALLARYLRGLGLSTITYAESDAAWLDDVRVPRVAPLHEAARIGLLLEPLGVPRSAIVAARPSLPKASLSGEGWQAALAEAPRPTIGIAPGSVWGTKRWTPEGFAELVENLLSRTAGSVVMLGSAGEKELIAAIKSRAGGKPGGANRIIDLGGVTTLKDLAKVYPRLDLVVSNDSSPVHYAAAYDVPTVAVFGATTSSMGFGPLASRSRVVEMDLDCRPCSDHGPQVCPLGHFKCMRELRAETVVAKCLELL